jgi:alkaline phosphatase D
LAYTFTYGAAAFFIMDTRTMRVKQTIKQRTMLGPHQWDQLEKWLLKVKDQYPVKFLVTSCALLFRIWFDVARDRWSGFPQERARLLSLLATHGIEGVYLLTGDLHSAHILSADLYGPGGQAIPLWEFCCSPFEQKTNRLARLGYLPLQGSPVKNQRLHKIYTRNNFGVVRVDYPHAEKPRVRLEIRSASGELVHEEDT